MKQIIKKEKKWVMYLEREQPIYLFASMINPYGNLLRKESGFCFNNQVFYYKNGVGEFWRLDSEMVKADKKFLQIILKDKKKFLSHIKKAKEFYKIGIKIISEYKKYTPDTVLSLSKIKKDQSITEKVILYSTVLPYRYLSAINSVIDKKPNSYKEALDLLEPLRQVSCYPDFVKYVYIRFFNHFKDKINVSKENFLNLTPQELFNKNKSTSDIIKRSDGVLFKLSGKNINFNFNKDSINTFRSSIINLKNIDIIKGSIAQKGFAKGNVSIINSITDIEKIKKGDILVSINTNPSLMSAILLSSGIITDEGGIMCHAAIVARELKKPCIIGTKIATKVLNDGDYVEVNADTGVVKILKRK